MTWFEMVLKNVPLEDVEEAKDMNDTKEKKAPIRLAGVESPGKSPAKLAALSVDIRKANVEADKSPATTKKSSFRLDQSVKARYKGGKKLFPGKISRVRSDGTYDIDYDDGEVETRVEVGYIEADDDEKRIIQKKNAGWEVGDRVKAFYGKGKRLFPGKISKVHMNGTYDIKYDDGDSELRVEASLIEGEKEKKKAEESLKMQKHSFHVGDAVKAKYKRGKERVEEDFIQPDVEDQADKPKKKALEVGDTVKARYKKGKKLFDGKVARVRSDGTYDIEYDDGDVESRVGIEMIEIRYSDNVVEEDVPSEALKANKKPRDSGPKRKRTIGFGTESLFLLEQLAMTLFEEDLQKAF
eukprot:jgi/Phyca11/19217/fgenesh1_pg.PHYCAscaffold_46_\